MKNITCYCEATFEANIPDEIDLDKDKDTLRNIFSGDFMSVTCPNCGKILKPEFPCKIISKKVNLFFIPELDRNKYLQGNLEYTINSPFRVVIGYSELVEKLKIYKANLNDEVVEMIKYNLLGKALNHPSIIEEEEAKIYIYFKKLENENLIFHIEGLKEDEIAVFKINMKIYNKVKNNLKQKKKEKSCAKILEPPYISINKIYREY